jgi:hypothetical protein
VTRKETAVRNMTPLFALGSILAVLPGASPAEGDRTGLSPAAATAWLNSWSHRMSLTVNPDSVSGTLADFPVVLVLGTDQQAVFDAARADGADIMVTKGDGSTPLSREIVEYDAATPHAEIWFKADVLSPVTNDFYLYYGNASADSALSDGSVWTDHYLGVYHFEGDPATQLLTDSSPGGHDALPGGAAVWSSSDVTPGRIGQAWAFDGQLHNIRANALSTTDSSYVISAWASLVEASTDFAFQANPDFWHVSFQTSDTSPRPHFQMTNPSLDLRWTPNPVPYDGFHNFCWVFDGVADTILFYFDGVLQPAVNWWNPDTLPFYTGRPVNPGGSDGVGIAGPMFYNNQDLVKGGVDEFRFSEGIRTGAWIATQVRNQRTPGGFVAYGPEEDDVVPTGVPAGLLAFSAERTGAGARIRWAVADPTARTGYHLYREDADGTRNRLTAALLYGRDFTFLDVSPPLTAVRYRLGGVSRDGAAFWMGSVVLPAQIGLFLSQNAPNPFAATSRIAFTLAAESPVRLNVYDAGGRRVAGLLDARLPSGPHQVDWDGRGEDGSRLAPGVYLYRLDAGQEHRVRKLVLLP